MALIDTCWSKLFRLELVLKRDRDAVATVRGSRLSSPGLRLRQDIARRKQRATRSTAKSCDPTVVSRSICRSEHIDLFQPSGPETRIDESLVEEPRAASSNAERRRG